MKTLKTLENTYQALYAISATIVLFVFVGVISGCAKPILFWVMAFAALLVVIAFILSYCAFKIEVKLSKKADMEYWNRLIANAEREEDEEAYIQQKLEAIRRARKEKP